MVGFELQISGIGSGCFANRATTTAHFLTEQFTSTGCFKRVTVDIFMQRRK